MSSHTDSYDARTTLQRQLAIAWNFATDFIIGQIDHDLALWRPVATSVTVHPTGHGWVADWPDEDSDDDLAPATIGWLLWHIEWWWTNTLATVHGRSQAAPSDFHWSGGTMHMSELKTRWDDVLANEDMQRQIDWFMPHPQSFGYIAGWLNFELGKNLAEINQLKMLHASHH